jgi:hypothetical protein
MYRSFGNELFPSIYSALVKEYLEDHYDIGVQPVKYIRSNKWKRKLKAGIDLVGVELNPGPGGKKGKSLAMIAAVKTAVNNAMNSSPKKKKSRNRKSKNQGTLARMANQVGGIPAAFGFVAPKSYFRTSSAAQKLADQDSLSAIRCHGCALFGTGISAYTTAGAANTDHGGFGTSSAIDRGYAVIAPTEIDPRLAALSQTYQFYAFRKIILKYIPFVGTSTNGGLYAAIAKDTEQAEANFAIVGASTGNSGGTPQDVLNYDPSFMTAIWQPAELLFTHTGTALWETYPNGEEPIDKRLQAAIVAITETTISNTTAYVYGHLWLEYEVDFYVPGPPLGAN